MRSLFTTSLAIATVAAAALLAHPAQACGTVQTLDDSQDFAQPPDQVTQLFNQADRLDARARQMDAVATQLDRSADTFATRSRQIRSEANRFGELERARLLAQADQLSAQAAISRANAQQRRAEASQLRVSARQIRQRAAQLAANGGNTNWRRRRPVPTGGDVI